MKTGNPAVGQKVTVPWPKYFNETDLNVNLAIPLSINSHHNAYYCDFWDSLGYGFSLSFKNKLQELINKKN